MLTNTYLPHVGGVARSVTAFAIEYQRRGHRVLIVAPDFDKHSAPEPGVIRVPAIERFNGSDFSAALPLTGLLTDALDRFEPDIVHSHHPFLLGMTALRVARYRDLPLVYTNHTRFEQYTHYVPANSPTLKRFVVKLVTRYTNLCDQVFAPSDSIAALMRERGTLVPIEVVPTGVSLTQFTEGDGVGFRKALGIPERAFVVGHLGRLAPEKNLEFLARAVAAYLLSNDNAHFLLVGNGPSESLVRRIFQSHDLTDRLHKAGVLSSTELADAYHAMDSFAFSSKSETQGMVLVEAMAAGVPVVGLSAPGVKEVVRNLQNGLLVETESITAFAAALSWIEKLPPERKQTVSTNARNTAESFSISRCATRALHSYERLLTTHTLNAETNTQTQKIRNLLKTEWSILKGIAQATGGALTDSTEYQ